MTKTQAIDSAAILLRVTARKLGRPMDEDMAWDALAERLNGTKFTASAQQVLAAAKRMGDL